MGKNAIATSTDVPRAEAIARLNDQLRKTGQGGSIVITSNLRRVTGFDAGVLDSALANYEGFDAGNDPYGERDLEDLTLFGHNLMFKIDYFDLSLTYGSDDPANPSVTSRILTVMLASDW